MFGYLTDDNPFFSLSETSLRNLAMGGLDSCVRQVSRSRCARLELDTVVRSVMDELQDFLGKVLKDSYRIDGLVGRGGMGVVYRASHTRLPLRVAIKVLHAHVTEQPDRVARFEREAKVTAALGHPNIVEVMDFDRTPAGTPFIVMEYLEGESLRTTIKREAPFDLGFVTSVAAQAGSALHAAHVAGIVHRDLKPSNLFLRRGTIDPQLKLLDFGVSKVMGVDALMTSSYASLGTPSYMSPEQATGRAAEVDVRTDVFALGTILYEMLAGKLPFSGESIPELLYKIVHDKAPRLDSLRPGLPDAVVDVVHWALEKDPTKRPESMQILVEALSEATRDYVQSGPIHVSLTEAKTAVSPSPFAAAPTGAMTDSRSPQTVPTAQQTTAAHAAALTQSATHLGNTSSQTDLLGRSPLHARLGMLISIAAVALISAAVAVPLLLGRGEPIAGAAVDLAVSSQSDGAASVVHLQHRADLGVDSQLAIAKPDATPVRRRRSDRQLSLITEPAGAVITIDGREIGKAPLRGVTIPAVRAKIVVRLDGFRRKTLWLPPGTAPARLNLRLQRRQQAARLSSPATLRVVTKHAGESIWAEVLVDGRRVGESALVVKLPPGRHRIRVQRPGYRPTSKTVVLRPGQTRTLVLELWRG